MKQPKTSGTEWLGLSLASFNGSGYADKQSPEHYVASYIAFKKMKKVQKAVDLATQNYEFALSVAEKLVDYRSAGMTPSEKAYKNFLRYYDPDEVDYKPL